MGKRGYVYVPSCFPQARKTEAGKQCSKCGMVENQVKMGYNRSGRSAVCVRSAAQDIP